MKWRGLITLVGLLAIASPAHAEQKLLIFVDAALTQSTIADNAPRIVSLYVVDADVYGNTGVRFSTEPSPGFTGVWLGDTSPFVTIGSSPTDIAIGYGTCIFSPAVVVLTMSYQLFGTSTACSELRVAPPPGFSCVPASSDGCAFVEVCIQELGSLHVNCPVATQPTTWGRVKALYRE